MEGDFKSFSDAGANPTGRWELVRSLGPSESSSSPEELKNGRGGVLQEIEALIRAGRLVRLGRLAVKLPSAPGEVTNPCAPPCNRNEFAHPFL